MTPSGQASTVLRRAILGGMALVAGVVAGGVLFLGLKPPPVSTTAADAGSGLVLHAEPKDAPDIVFADANGQSRRLSEWRGKGTVLNLWATWCAPCKKEMPSLDRLEAKLKGEGIAVLAVSTDRTGAKAPAAFFEKEGITHLALYNDDTAESNVRMKAPGLPLTIILNKDGKEVARCLGPADWDSPAIVSTIRGLLGSPAQG